MVAWVDTKKGRMQAAIPGAVVTLIGAGVLLASGGLAWAKWCGGVVALLGSGYVAWAFMHPSRSGLVPQRSEACRSRRHEACSAPSRAGLGCWCECHHRGSRGNASHQTR